MLDNERLRKVCAPDAPVEYPTHKHRCRMCGVTWQHNRDALDFVSEPEEFDVAHACPNCGTDERDHYPSCWTEGVVFPEPPEHMKGE